MNVATTHGNAKSYSARLILTEWQKQDDGGWVVRVWGLQGCATQGMDEAEARRGIIECYYLFEESYADDGDPLPWSLEGWESWPNSEMRWVKLEHTDKVG